MKKTIIALAMAALVAGTAVADEDNFIARLGFNGLFNGILLEHNNEAPAEAGGGFSGEISFPFTLAGFQNGLGVHLDGASLIGAKKDWGTDLFGLLGWWLRIPLGQSDFAFQPELDFGVDSKAGGAKNQISPLAQLGLSLRWNPSNFADGHVEFELTPTVGIETYSDPSLFVGGRVGVLWLFGKNGKGSTKAATPARSAREKQADSYIDALGIRDFASVDQTDEGLRFSLINIQFEPDSAVLAAGEDVKLSKVAQLLKNYDERLRVVGNTAKVGNDDEDADLLLSVNRARTVADYLIEQGVRPASEIIVNGVGSKNQLFSNDTEEGRAKNRRVEITVLDNK